MKFIVNVTKSIVLSVLIIVGLIVFSSIVHADAFELKEVSLNYRDFLPGTYYPLITNNGIPNRALDKELLLNLNSDLWKYGYWNNTVHTMTDKDATTGATGQFRLVGWEFRVGAKVFDCLDVGYYHHSQHLMDASLPYHFPTEDAVEIKIYLYSAERKGKGVF